MSAWGQIRGQWRIAFRKVGKVDDDRLDAIVVIHKDTKLDKLRSDSS